MLTIHARAPPHTIPVPAAAALNLPRAAAVALGHESRCGVWAHR